MKCVFSLLSCCGLILLLQIKYHVLVVMFMDADNDKDTDDWGFKEMGLTSSHGGDQCDYFMAPSANNMGWGVYAGRDFAETEVVNLPHLFLPMTPENNEEIVQQSILNDYVFGYDLSHGDAYFETVVNFGPDAVYNHHPENQNIEYSRLNLGDDHLVPGFVASRAILAGEQLFTTYGQADRGAFWFQQRGIQMHSPPSDASSIPGKLLKQFKSQYCSKIQVGAELTNLQQTLEGVKSLDAESRTMPLNGGFQDAKAKRRIPKGGRIELSSGLVMSTKQVEGTALGAVVWKWKDLQPEHQMAFQELRKKGHLVVQQQQPYSYNNRIDGFETFQDLAILPNAGGLGMVHRVSNKSEKSNCRLVIHTSEKYQHEGMYHGVTLELIATKDIDAGETLVLDLLNKSVSEKELFELKQLLDQSHQHYSSQLLRSLTVADDAAVPSMLRES